MTINTINRVFDFATGLLIGYIFAKSYLKKIASEEETIEEAAEEEIAAETETPQDDIPDVFELIDKRQFERSDYRRMTIVALDKDNLIDMYTKKVPSKLLLTAYNEKSQRPNKRVLYYKNDLWGYVYKIIFNKSYMEELEVTDCEKKSEDS